MKAVALFLLLVAASPALAQDVGLDPLILASREATAASDLEARGVQLYRLPFAFHLRSVDNHPWGLRVTFPISFTSLRLAGVGDIGGFVEKLGIAAIIPGLEVEIPAGRRALVRPFGEVGFGKSSDSSTEVFYGAGVRARTFRDVQKVHFLVGGQIAGRKTPDLDRTSDQYASFEAGLDTQFPLGFSIGGKAARGGVYVIGRGYEGLELHPEDRPPITMHGQFEAGISFTTDPDLRVWKIPLRWLGAGYQFGTVEGVRLYVDFPF